MIDPPSSEPMPPEVGVFSPVCRCVEGRGGASQRVVASRGVMVVADGDGLIEGITGDPEQFTWGSGFVIALVQI